MNADLPGLLVDGWDVAVTRSGRTATTYELTRIGSYPISEPVQLVLERCALGRLRDAYPVSEHDLELRVLDQAGTIPSALLQGVVRGVEQADPACRRVVVATPEGDLDSLAAAEAAGFRYVVTVDVAEGSLCLSVAEPQWVTHVDMDLDHVPQS